MCWGVNCVLSGSEHLFFFLSLLFQQVLTFNTLKKIPTSTHPILTSWTGGWCPQQDSANDDDNEGDINDDYMLVNTYRDDNVVDDDGRDDDFNGDDDFAD